MSRKTLQLDDNLYHYLLAQYPPEHPILAALRKQTSKMSTGGMQIALEQGHVMQFMVSLLNVKRYLEIGVFTGYSSLAVAQAMKQTTTKEGYILACDINVEWTKIAKKYWEQAGVRNMIDLKLGSATETLQHCIDENIAPFDLIFIDADKLNYLNYYKLAKQLLADNGMIMIDNVLWSGKVVEREFADEDTRAIQALNSYVQQDNEMCSVMLPISDGVTLIQKRKQN